MKKKPKDIEEIESRLNKINKKNEKPEESKKYSGGRVGTRIVIDLISAIFIGGTLGFFIDNLANTKPFFLVFMLLCGGGAGFLNIYRFLKKRENEEL